MSVTCPCCHQPLPEGKVPVDALLSAPLSEMQREFLAALVSAYRTGRPAVTRDALIDRAYADDPDGGPEWVATTVVERMQRIREKIEPMGWTIPRNKAGRGNTATYRLEPLP